MSKPMEDLNTQLPKPELDSPEQSLGQKGTAPSHPAQAVLLAAALAAASATQAAGATPATELDRAHLEALLYGSWTQPPDLSARRLTTSSEAESAQLKDQFAASFNDSGNPNPTPYHDKGYGDSGFGDRR